MEFTGERLIPDEQRQDDLYHEHLVRYLFAAPFAAGRRVLDAGCGAGYGTALLAESGAAAVLGVDLAPEAIQYAMEHYQRPNLSFAVQDLAAPNLPAGSFDLIISFEVIEHLDDPSALLRAADSLLAPGGLFIVSTPNPATYPPGNPFHKREMDLAQFTSVLKDAFPAAALYGQDYATALSLRPLGPGQSAWQLVPAAAKPPLEPDYFVAVCASGQVELAQALQQTRSIMYEVPADRLGERIRDGQRLERDMRAALDDLNRRLAEKNAYLVQLEQEQQRQAAWAAGLERQLLDLRNTWYVRLFGGR